jgi:hypothetical protein
MPWPYPRCDATYLECEYVSSSEWVSQSELKASQPDRRDIMAVAKRKKPAKRKTAAAKKTTAKKTGTARRKTAKKR